MATPQTKSGFIILFITTVALVMFLGVIISGFIKDDDEQAEQGGPQLVQKKNNGSKGSGGTSTNVAQLDPDALQWPTWPVPTAALILTGQQNGYVEPCGCSADQLGGVSRRADLIRQLNEKNWKTAGLDLGGLVKRNRLQSLPKFETMANALTDMNYKAVGVGPADLKLEPANLIGQQAAVLPNAPDAEAGRVAMLCANVQFLEEREFSPGQSMVFEHAGLKFGVTSVLGDSLQKEVKHLPDLTLTPAADAVAEAMQQINQANVDLKVLMSHGSMDEAKALARQFPDLDIVLTSGGAEDPNGLPGFEGKTIILNVGRKGKRAGVLAIYPDSNPKYRFDLVKLDEDRFQDTPGMIEHMRTYQQLIKDRGFIGQEASVGHPSGASFVGSDACADCHEEEYDIWKKTSHSYAFDSLDPANKKHGFQRLKGIPRTFDPECVCCHVVGWNSQDAYRYGGGFINTDFAKTDLEREMSPKLEHVGCESCHGPASRHIEFANEGEDEKARKEVRYTLKQAQSGDGCYKCHDLDNSPKFDFKEYWPKIEH